MPELNVTFANLEMDNPIVVSPGEHTADIKGVRRVAKEGAAGVVFKTPFLNNEYSKVLEEVEPHSYPDCRSKFVRVPGEGYFIISGLSTHSAEKWARWVKEFKAETRKEFPNFRIFASTIAVSLDGWEKVAKLFEEAGADAIEIDLSCPMRYLAPYPYAHPTETCLNPKVTESILRTVKQAVSIPCGPKYTAAYDQLLVPRVARACNMNFIVAQHSMAAAPPVDVESGRAVLPVASGAMVGPLMKYTVLATIVATAREFGYEDWYLSGSGGIINWKDATEYIMYGCTSFHICTALMLRGIGVIRQIKKDLLAFMARKGYERITDFRGMALEDLVPMEKVFAAYRKTQGLVVAEVDMSRCDMCGICVQACPTECMTMSDRIRVEEHDCTGCGLCVADCHMNALSLRSVDLLWETARKAV